MGHLAATASTPAGVRHAPEVAELEVLDVAASSSNRLDPGIRYVGVGEVEVSDVGATGGPRQVDAGVPHLVLADAEPPSAHRGDAHHPRLGVAVAEHHHQNLVWQRAQCHGNGRFHTVAKAVAVTASGLDLAAFLVTTVLGVLVEAIVVGCSAGELESQPASRGGRPSAHYSTSTNQRARTKEGVRMYETTGVMGGGGTSGPWTGFRASACASSCS